MNDENIKEIVEEIENMPVNELASILLKNANGPIYRAISHNQQIDIKSN